MSFGAEIPGSKAELTHEASLLYKDEHCPALGLIAGHSEKMAERILKLENKFSISRWSYQTHVPISLCGTKCPILGGSAFLIVQGSRQRGFWSLIEVNAFNRVRA